VFNRVLADGMAFGFFWLLSVVLGGSQAVTMRATMDHTSSALITFRTWIATTHMRIFVLIMEVGVIGHRMSWCGIHVTGVVGAWQSMMLHHPMDLSILQFEVFGTLTTMLIWRAVYTSVMRMFL
jgi:hypothetical protein